MRSHFTAGLERAGASARRKVINYTDFIGEKFKDLAKTLYKDHKILANADVCMRAGGFSSAL